MSNVFKRGLFSAVTKQQKVLYEVGEIGTVCGRAKQINQENKTRPGYLPLDLWK